MSEPYANEDVATALAGSGIGLTIGTNLFQGSPLQVQTGMPSQSVFCELLGGYGTPQRYLQGPYNEAGVGVQAREPRVHITVRSNPHDYQGGQTLARNVRDSLHDVPISGYDAVRIEQQEALFVYQTNNGEFVWTMDCHLWLDY